MHTHTHTYALSDEEGERRARAAARARVDVVTVLCSGSLEYTARPDSPVSINHGGIRHIANGTGGARGLAQQALPLATVQSYGQSKRHNDPGIRDRAQCAQIYEKEELLRKQETA